MSARMVLAGHTRRTALFLSVAVLAVLAGVLWFNPQPAAANPVTGIADVVAGEAHTCALTTTGGVKCWGDNRWGQLGDGSTADSLIPVAVSDLAGGIQTVTGGENFNCAVTSAGSAKCWGQNGFGQLGTTTGETCAYGPCSSTPVDVVGLGSGVASIDSGNGHACAVTVSGGLKCWGRNDRGQLGDGTTSDSATPVDVSGLTSGVASAAAGSLEHTCALTTSGGVKCWGRNDFGQVGDGTTAQRTTPVDVVGLASGVVDVSAGREYVCALMTSGGVKCWGFGFGTTPVDLVGLTSGVTAVSTSSFHLCAVTTGGGIKCRGQNGYGQLGDGTTATSVTPVDVIGFGGEAAAVGPGYFHTCAVDVAGGAKCWGFNHSGQLGNGRTSLYQPNPIPGDVVELTAKPTATITPCGPAGCPTPTETPTPPPQSGLDFSIGVDVDGDTADDCGTGGEAGTKCSMPVDSAFSVKVYLNSLPVGVMGYEAFDLRLDYAGVTSKDNASPGPWPDCGFPVNFFGPDFVKFGCIIGLDAPPSTYMGLIGTAVFNCAGAGEVTMTHGYPDTFLIENAYWYHEEGAGTTETLSINCVEPPTPLPPIGGVGVLPDMSAGGASGRSAGALGAVVFAAMAVGAIGLGTVVVLGRRGRVR